MKSTLVACLLLVLSATVSADSEQLILRNGHFDGSYSKGIAPGWGDNSGWADVDVNYVPEDKNARHGLAQRIICTRFKSGAVQFIQRGISIVKGGRYRITVWMKGDLGSPVEILLRKHGGPYTTYAAKGFRVSDNWREYTFVVTSPVDDNDTFFMIRFTSAGTLWLDDAVMVKVTADRLVDANVSNPAGNLIPNGSFEVGIDRWGALVREDEYSYEMPVNLLNPHPEIIIGQAKDGQRSLRVDLPAHSRLLLTSPYVKTHPGREYTLSFWAAAERPRRISARLASGHAGSGPSHDHTFQVSRHWNRYEFSTALPAAPEDSYYLLLDTSGEGRLWIDAVQLTEGKSSTFTARAEVEIGIDREDTPTLYSQNQHIRMRVLISSSAARGLFAVLISSTDYFGHKTILHTESVALKPGDQRAVVFSHPATQPGYFRIKAEVRRNDEFIDSSEMAIGVLAASDHSPSAGSAFGNHVRFSEQRLSEARKLGVSWIRMHPPNATKWFVVERAKGKFVFNDEPVLLAKSLGFSILGLLETTPRWASAATAEDGEYRVYPPKDIQAWEHYVYETVLHYKGVIDHWEVWNEPGSTGFLKVPPYTSESRRPEIYVELLKTAYRAAKRANPHAVIVGGCSTGQPPVYWFEKIFSHGAYDFMDVLSYHFYTDGRPGDALDTPTGVHIDDLRMLMRKYGKGLEKPIWETESGIMYPASNYQNVIEVAPGYLTPANEAAAYVVRNYVHILTNRVDKWFYYSMLPSLRTDRPDASGFHEWDGSPRPMALAYAVLAKVIGNATFVRKIEHPRDVIGAEFHSSNRQVQVLWRKGWWQDKRRVTVEIPIPSKIARAAIYDIMGRETPLPGSISKATVEVGFEPVYLVLTKPTASPITTDGALSTE